MTLSRRTPMKRTPIKQRAEGPTAPRERKPKAEAAPKVKVCTAPKCGKQFVPVRPLQVVCSPLCAKRKVIAEADAKRADFRLRREKIKSIPRLIEEAQREFNAYIRHRDHDKPCICCGRPLGTGDVGGAYDCGHYRSTGSAPHLRFDERNAHAQRKVCNRWGAGRAVDYRLGLIARIGLEAVESLESDNEVRKWRADELRAIRDEYRAKVRELKKAREA